MNALRTALALAVLSTLPAIARDVVAEPPRNASQPIARQGMPHCVHVFEDYETEIERRWWLVGEATSEHVPATTNPAVDNRRCCRATATKNFDRQREDQNTPWKAIIFNPVPGPPMGPRSRLSFRYRLSGTDVLRIQIYSLSKNYHRFLSLDDLPQNEWQEATVDMTAARRPDGSGGPLSEDERIDDIQFYIPPDADLWIDDIVLYDEAPAGETRTFPSRFLFTGWFDTGTQGKEWPGDFEIVLHEKPRTWDAARSVVDPQTGRPWIRLGLRGPRPLSRRTAVRFQYQLSGGEHLALILANSETGKRYEAPVAGLRIGGWAEATVTFDIGELPSTTDELHFLPGPGSTLLIDDVLLYEPGN